MVKTNIFLGQKVVEEIDSQINGKVQVVKSLAFGTYITAGNLTQSGGVVEGIWKKTLKKVHKSLITNNQSLILGLGGGSTAKVIRKLWPEVKITGVDIDPVMIELGKKHLKLDQVQVQVEVGDAINFLTKKLKNKKTKKYDLICVDLYIGDNYPEKFETDEFIGLVRGTLARGGVAVFNRLYYGEKRKEAMIFGERLKKHFSEVEYFFPQANLMLICRNN